MGPQVAIFDASSLTSQMQGREIPFGRHLVMASRIMASRRLGHLGRRLDDQLARRSITAAVTQIDGALLGARPPVFARTAHTSV
jgi:hypothetical protein